MPNQYEDKELTQKIVELIDGWRFEQEWVAMKAADFPEHKGAGCGCTVCQKMSGINTMAADGIMQLITQKQLEARIEGQIEATQSLINSAVDTNVVVTSHMQWVLDNCKERLAKLTTQKGK